MFGIQTDESLEKKFARAVLHAVPKKFGRSHALWELVSCEAVSE